MTLPDDIELIVSRLQFAADHPKQYTRQELATLLAMAAGVIREMQTIAGDGPDYRLNEIDPEGRA